MLRLAFGRVRRSRRFRAAVVEARHSLRPILAKRSLPHFVIIGASRSGTTSLYYTLVGHPRITRAIKKEMHYFSSTDNRGEGWYRAHFPTIRSLRRARAITGEASGSYIYSPRAAEQMRARLPDAKVIAILRNPIDRALSHYALARKRGWISKSFDDVVTEELRIAEQNDSYLPDDPAFGNPFDRGRALLARGRYAEQLERWFAAYPPEQVLVLIAEDLFANPAPNLRLVLEMLGIEHVDLELRHSNAESYLSMSATTRAVLAEYFRPYNEHLRSLLGREIRWDC